MSLLHLVSYLFSRDDVNPELHTIFRSLIMTEIIRLDYHSLLCFVFSTAQTRARLNQRAIPEKPSHYKPDAWRKEMHIVSSWRRASVRPGFMFCLREIPGGSPRSGLTLVQACYALLGQQDTISSMHAISYKNGVWRPTQWLSLWSMNIAF